MTRNSSFGDISHLILCHLKYFNCLIGLIVGHIHLNGSVTYVIV